MNQTVPVIGIVGGGQLAQMMYQEAIALGLSVKFLAGAPEDPVVTLSPNVTFGSPHDSDALTQFAQTVDVLTFDHELVNLTTLETLENTGLAVRPSSRALSHATDKWQQRTTFAALGLPLPAFINVQTLDDIEQFGATTSWPVVLKAQRGGYDGRGVWIVNDIAEARTVMDEAMAHGLTLYAEELIALNEEIAILVARDINGNAVTYPLVHSVQENGICRETLVLANDSSPIVGEAKALALQIAEALDVCGVMAVEMFVSNGRVLINEIATRPHNTGHYSIEGAVTSQFANHLRAVAGLPLGPTTPTAPAIAMVNVLGGARSFTEKEYAQALAVDGAHVHMYGKAWRPGRKLGHVTVCAETPELARARAHEAAALLETRKS